MPTAAQTRAVLRLLADGATIPFIARYRKEQTGGLDEVAIADIQKAEQQRQAVEQRRASILKAIEEQGKLTPALRRQLDAARDLTTLEDLYLPYKRKRTTRAAKARARGLEPLADWLLTHQQQRPDREADRYRTNDVKTRQEALDGAKDIIAERINEDQPTRQQIRKLYQKQADVTAKVVKGKQEEGSKYRDYFEYSERITRCPSHRVLALLRAEQEGIIRLKIAPDTDEALRRIDRQWLKGRGAAADVVAEAIEDAYKRLLAPSIATETRNALKARADADAIAVFADNLRQLLLAAPLGEQRVLAIDPGYRTGCKVVCLDERGDLLHDTVIYPHPPQSQQRQSLRTLTDLAERYRIEAIAIGNGTAGRETQQWLQSSPLGESVPLYLVNENGASIYSASEVAREEFPDADITVRGAVSIGRRLMDPLAELVKIDAKSIGVGQYQHDVHQGSLRESLDRTVEHCVNNVGVNLNTASAQLLQYVSGITPSVARNIVAYRSEQGPYTRRAALRKVPRLGAKAYEQCAGFLRIRDADHPLDNTGIHPERYELVDRMAHDLGTDTAELLRTPRLLDRLRLSDYLTDEVGMPTLQDILKELRRPGHDPRGAAEATAFADVSTIDDLYEGQVLPGIVTNVTRFGAFVDIGIKENGLVHISQLADRYVSDPAEVVQLQQAVQVRVVSIDRDRGRVGLSMKGVG